MTRTPHDALFKAAFARPEQVAYLFTALLPTRLHHAVAWSTLESEGATSVDPKLRRQRNDLLFSAHLRDPERREVYFILEHQSQIDERMALRVLAYLVRFWESKPVPLPPVVAIVLSHEPEGWTAPTQLRELVAGDSELIPEFADFLPNFSLQVADLSRLSHDDLMGWPLDPFPKLALLLLRDARTPGELLRTHDIWLPLFAELVASPNHETALAQLLHYIFLVVSEEEFEQIQALIADSLPQTGDTFMTKAEALIQQGREEGREEGRQEGLSCAVLQLLTDRFGPLSPAQTARVEAADTNTLGAYMSRILSATSIHAVLEGDGST